MKHFSAILLVGFGGSLGSVLRYLITVLLQPMLASFPLSTLLINMGGCLVIGAMAGLIDASITIPSPIRLFIITGFCGGFTTMSSFVYEVDRLLRNGQSMQAFFYFGSTIAGSFALFFAGYFLMKVIFKSA